MMGAPGTIVFAKKSTKVYATQLGLSGGCCCKYEGTRGDYDGANVRGTSLTEPAVCMYVRDCVVVRRMLRCGEATTTQQQLSDGCGLRGTSAEPIGGPTILRDGRGHLQTTAWGGERYGGMDASSKKRSKIRMARGSVSRRERRREVCAEKCLGAALRAQFRFSVAQMEKMMGGLRWLDFCCFVLRCVAVR